MGRPVGAHVDAAPAGVVDKLLGTGTVQMDRNGDSWKRSSVDAYGEVGVGLDTGRGLEMS